MPHHTTHKTHHHRKNPIMRMLGIKDPRRVNAGYKAAINNPNVSSEGRAHAKHELHMHGHSAPREKLSTRLRHMLGMGGRRHHAY